jgi:hypothetical protein
MRIFSIVYMLLEALPIHAAQAGDVFVGVNVYDLGSITAKGEILHD